MNNDPVRIHAVQGGNTLPVRQIGLLARGIYGREHISVKKKTDLVCCSDYFIRKLNRDYRNNDKATDVLSFSFDEPDFFGEIYISLQRTEVQARRFGTAFEEEFIRLFIHGLLHLAGYDHMQPDDRAVMEKKEWEYRKLTQRPPVG
jgi:rRNA maturation RNase YbeY